MFRSNTIKIVLATLLLGGSLWAGDIETRDGEGADKVIKSSIQAEKGEAAMMKKINAVVPLSEALDVLKADFEGRVMAIRLCNEEGNVVYKAEILGPQKMTDIIIDAGNKKILYTHDDQKDGDEEGDCCHNEEEEPWYAF